jgi:hypothetical protein
MDTIKYYLIALALLFSFSPVHSADTLTYSNKYNLYNLVAGSTTVSNVVPTTVDTQLYLGDSYT